MARQQDRRLKTRQKIVNAARKLFLKQGFEGTTLDQILEHANIVKGTFYQHFDTKMDLLVVVGRQEGIEKVERLIESVKQGASALDALRRYYLVLAQWFEQHAAIAQDVIISAIHLHSPHSNAPESIAHDFSKLMLEMAKTQNEIRTDIDVNSQALVIGGAFTLAVIDWSRDPVIGQLQKTIDDCMSVFLHGVSLNQHANGGKA